jgi:hypothetical protein
VSAFWHFCMSVFVWFPFFSLCFALIYLSVCVVTPLCVGCRSPGAQGSAPGAAFVLCPRSPGTEGRCCSSAAASAVPATLAAHCSADGESCCADGACQGRGSGGRGGNTPDRGSSGGGGGGGGSGGSGGGCANAQLLSSPSLFSSCGGPSSSVVTLSARASFEVMRDPACSDGSTPTCHWTIYLMVQQCACPGDGVAALVPAAGTYGSEDGSIVWCPADHWCPTGASAPIPCVPGYPPALSAAWSKPRATPVIRAPDGTSHCHSQCARKGTAAPREGVGEACEPCPRGWYSEDSTAFRTECEHSCEGPSWGAPARREVRARCAAVGSSHRAREQELVQRAEAQRRAERAAVVGPALIHCANVGRMRASVATRLSRGVLHSVLSSGTHALLVARLHHAGLHVRGATLPPAAVAGHHCRFGAV